MTEALVKPMNEAPVKHKHDISTTPRRVYNLCLSEVMRRNELNRFFREADNVSLMVSSHDEDTIRYTLNQMSKYAVYPSDNVVCFTQLLGLGDYISLPLVRSGYSVCKHVHFGPKRKPLREIFTNTDDESMIQRIIKKEKQLLWKELWRRLKNG